MSRTYRRYCYEPWKGKTFRDGRASMGSTPSWWITEFMTRPERRKNKRLCNKVLKGADPDNIAWPLGTRKPHIYYW
jgi:hypothetical protein